MTSLVQRSFAGGEIAPALYGRADQAKYATGARTVRNFVVQRFGGVTNRPGTRFIAEVKNSDDPVALLRFEFNDEQTYALEFGDFYMRVYRAGERLTVETAVAWDDGSGGQPWNDATAYDVGDHVVDAAVRYICTAAHTSNAANDEPGIGANWGDFWELSPYAYVAGNLVLQGTTIYYCYVDHDANAATNWPGVGTDWEDVWYPLPGTFGAEVIYEIPTPYAAADVGDLRYVQSADVVTLVHPSYPPAELRRTGHTSWTLVTIDFNPGLDPPSGVAMTGTAGSAEITYAVTAVSDDGAESLPGLAEFLDDGSTTSVKAVVSATSSSGILLLNTSAAHGFKTGDEVELSNFVGGPAGFAFDVLNGRRFIVDEIDSDTFRLRNTVSSQVGLVSGTVSKTGRATLVTVRNSTLTAPTTDDPITVTWSAAAGAREYNIYRKQNGVSGYLGTTTDLKFIDDGSIGPNNNETPPSSRAPFASPGNYPSVVSYFQQRQVFAAPDNAPEKIWLSGIGDFHNFATRSPLQDDDSFSFTMAGRKVNTVRHVLDIGKMVVLTSGGEWTVHGDQDGVVTPSTINLHQEGYQGSSDLDPIVVGNSALFVQARGTIVRDLRYEFSSDGYPSRDLTLYASHLFGANQIIDWAYAQIPHSVVWAARDDGTLLGLTYVRDQEVWGWHRHDTGDGDAFERVITIPEDGEDAVYVVVRRTVNGAVKRYIERFASREFTNIAIDAVFVDAALTTDGRHTGTTTMTLTGGTAWLYTETLTLTASAGTFSAGDVGNQIRLTVGGVDLRVEVTGYTSPTVVSVRAVRTVDVAFRGVAVATWARAVTTITGLSHLEGRTVAVLGDGNVDPQQVVTAGQVTLSRPCVIAHVGLPYTSDLETLDVEAVNAPEPLANRKKRVTDVTVYLEESRGMWIGPTAASQTEWKQRATENMGDPTALFTGTHEQRFPTTWNDHGRLLFSQRDPLPLTILAVIPTLQVGG